VNLSRRTLLKSFLPSLLLGQYAATKKDGSVHVCAENTSTVKCPQGHETCRNINAPLVVGNGDYNYPNWAQLTTYKLLWCDTCGALFAEHQP
jgi:hypothetical protein